MANKFKESKLRTRQAAKTAIELMHCLENMSEVSKQNIKKEFISPLEMVRKNVHWEEFAASSRRIILSLKTELAHLSQAFTPDIKMQTLESGKTFIFLFSSSKKCIQLFKGLAKFPNEIEYGKRGYKLKEEVTCVTRQLILLMSLFGILPVNIGFEKFSKNEISIENDLPLNNDASDSSINISTSDLDSDAANILESENVRHKLSNLAETHLAKNKKHKKGKIAFKTIQPLKKIQKPHIGVTEDLADGRRVQFIHDSLSHKLRKKDILMDHSSPVQHSHKNQIPSTLKTKGNEHHPNSQYTMPRYGVSEMAADMVFERLLPHLRTKTAINENPKQNNPGEVDGNILTIKLINLSERLVAVEKANDRREKYAKHLEQLTSSWNESEEGFMDLSTSIKLANISLQKVSEFSSNYTVENAELRDKYLYSGEHTVHDHGRKMQDSFYGTLNSNFDLNLKRKLNHKRPLSNFPSLQEELQAQRNEFWTSLIENNYIIPPTPNDVNELPVHPTNKQETINSQSLVKDSIRYDKISKGTQIGEPFLDENNEIKQKTSKNILSVPETQRNTEKGEDRPISDKESL